MQRARDELDPALRLDGVPGRVLLDTCVLNRIYEDGGFIFDGEPSCFDDDESGALRWILLCNDRAHFQLCVSPLTIAEIANGQNLDRMRPQLLWTLEVIERWLIMLDESGDRARDGGPVRHRFKLGAEAQDLEKSLLAVADFRRDPVDRLLIIQSKLADCGAFITLDKNTIWRHNALLWEKGIRVLRPTEYWAMLRPWAGLWL